MCSGFDVERLAKPTYRCLAKAIAQVGWGMFQTMLKYKAENEGKVYQEVDRLDKAYCPDVRPSSRGRKKSTVGLSVG